MNTEEVNRLASEAGLQVTSLVATDPALAGRLARFAELVRVAEREACARLCEGVEAAHHRVAVDNWEFFLPTEHEDGASRGAGECAQAIRQLLQPAALPGAA